ncbi:hypothetical protein [uncultured Dokdonia sp.]|uniref:hypothetical protein n=1 Tax=uncultured Dokdonia sp. TaxID=575653 RepID=UPI00263A0221|nr:hypothetical protein [uncultured Dokdonia sp.]
MIAIDQNKVKAIQVIFSDDIKKQREKAIKKLKTLNNEIDDGDDKVYLESIISLFNDNTDILLWDSTKLNNEKDKIGEVPLIEKLYKGRPKKVKSSIKNAVLDKLGYKALRDSFYPEYFKDIGIKACVYCNSQLTITAIKSKGEYSAKFDVDHYHSKDEYPFLSICLFNLYPSCTSCNRAKSNEVIEFNLYTDVVSETLKSDYEFKLTPYSKANYLLTKKERDIKIAFIEPEYKNKDAKTFKDVFHIEGLYETQKDVIEELFVKAQMYNRSYLKILKSNFQELSLNPELFKRALIGNYIEEKDLHKRPMSKLMMDVAKDLDLI